jgi:hypothetical protein
MPPRARDLVVTVAISNFAACGGSPPRPQSPGSRGMRASEHLEAAQQQDELAREQGRYPETRPDATGRVDMPWHWTWDAGVDHERLAAVHRSAAAELHAAYDEACAGRTTAEISESPLARYGIGGEPTSDGVVLALSPEAGPPERLLADVRCHRAWMMLAPSDMETCPLDLAGIHVDASGDKTGITVTITVHDPALVPELQRRAARDLESSRHAQR